MNETGPHRVPPDQSLGSGHSFGTPRHPSIIEPILSKRVCFYKSGDPQFSGLRMVINNRTFKTFEALLDSLSKKVPLPFGVRNITTPRGVHAIHDLSELEDGKSYICSDSRKVKPINLAHARKKLPPWYHARPVSSRRRTVQRAKFFPGQNLRKKAVVRTPKRLLVFRNGNPNVKYTVMIHKRTTTTFESVLGYISELIQFRVVKLHTPDGRRVDGLPGLILCSGIVVAAGREPFRPANYNVQKSPVSATLPTNQSGVRRRKAFNRKKKPPSYNSESRKFSPSSERYIVNQIHDSIAESSCDLPSIPTNSVELDSGRILESVAETEDDICLSEGGGQEGLLPSDDDIEKSFRVNQDGSMTVEMRVRLTIKEEETVQWTTTLSRSSVTNQLNGDCLSEPEAEQEILSLKSNLLDLESPVASINANEDKTEANNDKDLPSLSNGAFTESSNEEDHVKDQTNVVPQRRAPTPGHKLVRRKQASVESVTSVMPEGIQEDMIGSYSYREQMENGAVTEQYCMVKQSSTKPVPKPRRLDSMNAESRNLSTIKSSEMLQTESSCDDVAETVLHIYEQPTCQDSYLANLCVHGSPGPGIPLTRREESTSVASDSTLPTFKSGASNDQQQSPNSIRGKEKPQQRNSKAKVSSKRVHQLVSPGRRQKEKLTKISAKNKKITFSSAGFIKKIYGTKQKSAKNTKKLKKGPAQNGNEGVTGKSSQKLDETAKHVIKAPDGPPALEETQRKEISYEKSKDNGVQNIESQTWGIQTETSEHQDNKNSKSISPPAFSSACSITNEYVESWLEKSHLDHNKESKGLEATSHVQIENSSCGNKNESMVMAKEVKILEETSEKPKSLTTDLPAEIIRRASVKERVQSFENKSSNQAVKKITTNQPINNHTTKTDCTSLAQNHVEEHQPLSNHHCSELSSKNKKSTDILLGSEDKSRQVKVLLKDTTSLNSLSMELPPPPPPAENMDLSGSEHLVMDVSSAVSSPLYRLSSMSSQTSDNDPLAVTPTSNQAVSPTNHTVGMATSIYNDIPPTLEEAPLQRTPSIKRAPLVSNGSLDRKMSLRKARVDKYALCSNAAVETTTSPTSISVEGDHVLLDSTTRIQLPGETQSEENPVVDLKNSPSCCSSAYPASLTSEERMSSASVSSSEALTPNNLPSKEAKTSKSSPLIQKNASSPKTIGNKKKISSPSPERRSQSKKSSSKLSHNSPQVSTHKHNSDKTLSPNIGAQKHATPNKPKLQKTPSPYSQSLDVTSPPVRHTANRKVLSRNLSSDNASRSKISSERKRHRMPQSAQSTAEVGKVLTCDAQADVGRDNKLDTPDKTEDIISEGSMPETQKTPQPKTKPVLEEVCSSIKLIRQMIQNKSPPCLEKSNSLPDFSSHVASTFGSSSKALLAFLSIMTLKDCITKQNMEELNASEVSCDETLKMIASLREIAGIEDSHYLNIRLSNLQRSASEQLLQCWRCFQELSDSRSSIPNHSERELASLACAGKDRGISENVIDEIVDRLGMPEKLKEELSFLSAGDEVKKSSLSTDEATGDSKYGVNGETKCPPAEPNEESQLYSKVLFVDDNAKGIQFSGDTNQEREQEEHDESKSSRESVKQNSKEGDDFFSSENHSEEEQDKQSKSCYYVQLNVKENRRMSSPESQNQCLSEEKHSKVECTEMSQDALSHHESPSNSEDEQQRNAGCGGYSDVCEPLSEEELSENEYRELEDVAEERLSCNEVEERSFGEEAHLREPPDEAKKCDGLNALKEEKEEVSSEDEDSYADKIQACDEKQSRNSVEEDLDRLVENQDSYTQKDKSDVTVQHCRFSADSRTDHSSCDERAAEEEAKDEDEQISSSNEEELSYYGKESSSEEEHSPMDGYIEYEDPASLRNECEKAVKHPGKEKISQSIAERVILLEKQVADAQNRKNAATRSPMRRFSQRHAHLDSDGEDSELPTSESALGTRSAPQSSLSFSYDSSGVITTEPEGNRVRSIREMFLAKSATDIQHGRFPSPNTAELSELRAETSVSGGYQSQTSSDLSGSEDDSARKTITKGFVRRTIERLYGKKDVNPDDDGGKMLPSVPKQKANEQSNIFSPFHAARAKAMSELSYFSSNNALDTLGEATRCIAFNTQVRPGDGVPVENGRWLLRENTMIRKSVSEPAGINTAYPTSPQGEGIHESTEKSSRSLFSTKSEQEDKSKSLSSKCTYFSLPHATDSDVCQDDLNAVTKSSMNGGTTVETKGDSDITKTRAERNGKLPGVSITEFKMMDNKVHPATEPPPDGEVVVAQPVRGQGALNRRLQEPDMLDLLYDFCGQNCPIL
ncbi:oxygen-regulated protein 1-like isoform X2 [Antennarius striatus]